jgi:hypothetical protein
MEQDDLKSIAANLFQIMPEQDYKSKSASEIELAAQVLVNQLASVLLQDFLLPARIEQIHSEVEDGSVPWHDCQG